MKIESKRYLVLWDVDGTLISNSQSDEELFVQMVCDVLGPQDRIEHPYRHGKTDRMMVREYVMANGGSPEDVPRAAKRLRLSQPTVTAAMKHLVKLGVVREMTGRRRSKVYAYHAYLKLLGEGAEPIK